LLILNFSHFAGFLFDGDLKKIRWNCLEKVDDFLNFLNFQVIINENQYFNEEIKLHLVRISLLIFFPSMDVSVLLQFLD
jgi:hypothetical protein